jgi:hypothetical protein
LNSKASGFGVSAWSYHGNGGAQASGTADVAAFDPFPAARQVAETTLIQLRHSADVGTAILRNPLRPTCFPAYGR